MPDRYTQVNKNQQHNMEYNKKNPLIKKYKIMRQLY